MGRDDKKWVNAGFADGKVAKYGKDIIEIVKKYV